VCPLTLLQRRKQKVNCAKLHRMLSANFANIAAGAGVVLRKRERQCGNNDVRSMTVTERPSSNSGLVANPLPFKISPGKGATW